MLDLVILYICAIANILLALLVLVKNPRSATNRLFSALAFFLAAEPVFNYFSLNSASHLFFIRLVMSAVVLMALVFRFMSVTYPKSVFTWTAARVTELLVGLAIAGLAFTSLLFSGLVISPSGNISPTPAPGLLAFALFSLYAFGGGIWTLVRRARKSQGIERAQLRYMVVGAAVMFGLEFAINFFVVLILKVSSLVSFTPIYQTIFAACVAVAIVRHRLFNIRLVVARSIAYLLLLSSLAVLYTGVIFTLTQFFFHDSRITTAQSATYVGVSIIVALTFQPLRRFFEKLTDRVFYRDRYDSQQVLNRLSTVLVTEMHLGHLLYGSLKLLCDNLHLSWGQFIIFREDRVYKIEHFGTLPNRLMIAPNLMKLGHGILVADELEEGERKEILENHSVRLSAQLKTKDGLVGFLLLGDKLSGDIYSNQDIELIQIATKELSVAISNARAYEEIRELNESLQERVKHATARLRTANRHLKELDKAKDEFISMASHQLRTPLTTIKGYLSMMLEGDAGRLNATEREYIQYAFDGSERMVSLISDLLNVSRLSAGRFLIEQKPTDLVAMIEDEIRQLMPHATAKRLYLKLDAPAGKLPLVELDENKTRQVIMNFIDNAIYYTHDGGVTVRLRVTKGLFRIEVQDTGIGVPEDAKKHLFTKFFRASNAQNVRPDGTGLGLYLARRVVQDQGGTIIFESQEGRGSVFGFELPVKGVSRPAASQPAPVKKVPTHV